MSNEIFVLYDIYIYNICTLSVNIKFICTSFRNRQNSEPSASFSGPFRSEYKWILYLTTMYVYCVYPAKSKKSENLSDLNKKDRNKRHSSPFINVVKGVFFVVRVTLVPVSYFFFKFKALFRVDINHTYNTCLRPPLYIATGYQESLFVGWKVYSSTTNKSKIYWYSIFVQQMYWSQDKNKYYVTYKHDIGSIFLQFCYGWRKV
jgi:hypothetical protein